MSAYTRHYTNCPKDQLTSRMVTMSKMIRKMFEPYDVILESSVVIMMWGEVHRALRKEYDNGQAEAALHAPRT